MIEEVKCASLPTPVLERLAEFCAAHKSGNLQLDIKEGRIVNGRLTEAISVVDKDRHLSK